MIQILEVNQGTQDWHQLREGKYTGSNAWKLLKYGATEDSVTLERNFKGNFYTERGHVLEASAIELYERLYDVTVLRPGLVTNSRYPKVAYSPDGVCGNTLLEVKCFNEKKHRACSNGTIPLAIQAQVHFGLFVCNLPQAHLIFYNPDLPAEEALKIVEVKNNPRINANFKKLLKGV